MCPSLDFFLPIYYNMTKHDHTQCIKSEPAVNWKCIIFTLILSGGYWFLPQRNKWILLSLLYFPYILLAYYDHWYQCKRNMGPTYLAMFYWWAKPKDSHQVEAYKNWCPDIKNRVFMIDLVILGIGVLLLRSFISWQPK